MGSDHQSCSLAKVDSFDYEEHKSTHVRYSTKVTVKLPGDNNTPKGKLKRNEGLSGVSRRK